MFCAITGESLCGDLGLRRYASADAVLRVYPSNRQCPLKQVSFVTTASRDNTTRQAGPFYASFWMICSSAGLLVVSITTTRS